MPHSAATAPADWYRDPARWERERTGVFQRCWHFVTHESALDRAGAYVADNLAGYPIVLVRDEAGAINGFHNVCRHRAGPLVNAEAGVCEGAFVCAYHGWRYTFDGRLRSARDFGQADDFDVRAYGLFPLTVTIWRGLVFVAMNQDAPPLAALLAPIEARLAGKDWSKLRIAARTAHHLSCNWKAYVENYLEGYHVPLLHPALDADVDATQYKVTVEGRVALHDAPPKRPDAVYDGLWAWVWPNVAFNVYARGVMMERMSPVGHDKTRLDYLFLMPEGEGVAAETLAMSEQVLAEDKWIVECVQENLNAGVYDRGRLSPKHEGAVAAFQAWVGEAVG